MNVSLKIGITQKMCFKCVFLRVENTLKTCSNIQNFKKQPTRGVLRKGCSENMQQIYRKTLMPKCNFKFANSLHIFRKPFPKNISGGLLLNFENVCIRCMQILKVFHKQYLKALHRQKKFVKRLLRRWNIKIKQILRS